FLKDTALRFVAVNAPFCRAVGRAEADILGKTDLDLYPPELAERNRAADRQVLARGARLEAEEQNLISGQLRTVRVVKTPVRREGGGVGGVLGIFWDVTEQRALEGQLQQAQKMEAVGLLAGGVAHEFNNLLTVILGNISLTLHTTDDADPNHELLAAAELACTRAGDLTQQLLGFSRYGPWRPQPTHLRPVVGATGPPAPRHSPPSTAP